MPCRPLPHPAKDNNASAPMTTRAKRMRGLRPRRPLNAIPTIPNTGKSRAAYNGDLWRGPSEFLAVAATALPLEVVTVIVTLVNGWVVVDGLKVHAVPTGRPPQPKVIGPCVVSWLSTSKVKVAEPPATTLAVVECGVITIGGPRLMVSVAVLFAVLVSPPPETLAVLVKLFWMLIGIFTVSVIGG